MKKLALLYLTLALVMMCLSACSSGGNSTGPSSESSQDTPNQTQSSGTTSEEATTQPAASDSELDGIAYVGGRSITINYDDSRRKDAKSDSLVFHSQMSNVIALTYDKDVSFSGSVAEVFDILNDGDLFNNISSYMGSAFSDSSTFEIEVDSSEKKTVAGFETINITGSVVDSSGKTGFVYAYTFVIDETPCMLVGIVIDKVTNADAVSGLKTEVDNMAETIREE